MAHNPIAPRRRLTWLELARRDYLAGRITVDEFEEQVDQLFRGQIADVQPPLQPPPKRSDARRSAVPPR